MTSASPKTHIQKPKQQNTLWWYPILKLKTFHRCELNLKVPKSCIVTRTFTEGEKKSSDDWSNVTLSNDENATGIYKAELPPEISENFLVQHYWLLLVIWLWLMLLFFWLKSRVITDFRGWFGKIIPYWSLISPENIKTWAWNTILQPEICKKSLLLRRDPQDGLGRILPLVWCSN